MIDAGDSDWLYIATADATQRTSDDGRGQCCARHREPLLAFPIARLTQYQKAAGRHDRRVGVVVDGVNS